MRLWAIAFALLGGLACGCGSGGRGDLTGEVTLDDRPLERGSILLVPLDPSTGTAAGGEVRDGAFSLTGKQAPAVGAYRVEIRAMKKSGRKVQKAMGQPGELEDEVVEAVAPRFNSATGLQVDVKAGGNTAQFAVTSR
jgi:hypothetical protein